MSPVSASFHQFLNSHQSIPGADFACIAECLVHREVPAGAVLLREGAVARELYFVVSGVLKIVTASEVGREVVQFFVGEGKCCTILYSFRDGVAAQEGIVAATDTVLLAISRAALEALYVRLPYFKGLLEGIIQQALLDKIRLRNELMGEEATVRYRKFGMQQPQVLQRVPLGDVAAYLGITPQSLSRIRRALAAGK